MIKIRSSTCILIINITKMGKLNNTAPHIAWKIIERNYLILDTRSDFLSTLSNPMMEHQLCVSENKYACLRISRLQGYRYTNVLILLCNYRFFMVRPCYVDYLHGPTISLIALRIEAANLDIAIIYRAKIIGHVCNSLCVIISFNVLITGPPKNALQCVT